VTSTGFCVDQLDDGKIPVSPTERYELLLQHLQTIRVGCQLNALRELVDAKYQIGKAVSKSQLYTPENRRLFNQICRDLNWSRPELTTCIRLYEKAGDDLDGYLETQDFGPAVSWVRIKQKLLAGEVVPKTPPQDQPFKDTKTSRLRAALLGSKKIGKVWSQSDQARLERVLNVVLTKKERGATP
jgi:hypothetical protein